MHQNQPFFLSKLKLELKSFASSAGNGALKMVSFFWNYLLYFKVKDSRESTREDPRENPREFSLVVLVAIKRSLILFLTIGNMLK